MIRIKLIFFFCVGILFGQTKWSKCKVDDTKLRECLDGEVKKKEWNKWYIAYECESENTKHYYWVANKIISDDAITSPWRLGLSILGTILGTYSANNPRNFVDSSDEIIPLIKAKCSDPSNKFSYILIKYLLPLTSMFDFFLSLINFSFLSL